LSLGVPMQIWDEPQQRDGLRSWPSLVTHLTLETPEGHSQTQVCVTLGTKVSGQVKHCSGDPWPRSPGRQKVWSGPQVQVQLSGLVTACPGLHSGHSQAQAVALSTFGAVQVMAQTHPCCGWQIWPPVQNVSLGAWVQVPVPASQASSVQAMPSSQLTWV